MSPFFRCLFFTFWCVGLQAQCLRTVTVTIHSINFAVGCDLNENNGIDAVLEIRDANGDDIYLSEFENLSQARTPQDSVLIDLSINPNSCGDGTRSFLLGVFPADQLTAEFDVEIFDRDNIFPCVPYFRFSDDDYGGGQYAFELTETAGIIDVGSCISFNYNLEFEIAGSVISEIDLDLCPSDSLVVNGVVYDQDNLSGQEVIPNSVYGFCDSIINVNIGYLPEADLQLVYPDTVCPNEEYRIITFKEYETYQWSTGSNAEFIDAKGGGSYGIKITDSNGCKDSVQVEVEQYMIDSLEVIGDTNYCRGGSTILSFDTTLYQSYGWNSAQDTFSFKEFTTIGSHFLTVIDSNLCRQTLELFLTYEEQDTFYIEREVCDPNLVGIRDSLVTDTACELHIINTSLRPEVECQIEVVVMQLEYPCEPGEYVYVSVSMVEGSLPFDFLLYSYPGGVSWAGARIDDPSDVYSVQLPVGQFEVIAKNQNGLEVSYRFDVERPEELNYVLDNAYQVDSGQVVTLTVNGDLSNIASISWTDSVGNVICDDCDALAVAPIESQVYLVTITDDYGCMYEELVAVTVIDPKLVMEDVEIDDSVFIPNVFSPRDNSENGSIKIFGPDLERIEQVRIYDRWGGVLYVSDSEESWDGTSDGQLVSSGVYIACFDISYINGTKKTHCDDVTVLK